MVRVAQICEVFDIWRAPAEYAVELLVQFCFDIRILREEHPCPRQCVRGRFVAGQENRDGFIAQLAVRHARAVLVSRGQQHGEQITVIDAAGTALVNESIDDAI